VRVRIERLETFFDFLDRLRTRQVAVRFKLVANAIAFGVKNVSHDAPRETGFQRVAVETQRAGFRREVFEE
jgi:hypothetical protein